mgnify:CR=1 FL=1
MINKRLIGTVPDSKPYIAGNVALQWLSLLSNAGMIFSCAWFLQQLLEGAAAPRTLALPLAAGLAAVLVRGICTAGAGRMSFLAARSVKRTLRRSIYEKLLRLGPAYNQNVATSEAVQLAAEGVEQLETYFGAYLPQFFYSMLAPATLFALLAPVSLRAALALLVCVPLIPAAIAAVQTFAKKLLGRYWGQYTALGDTFLENLQGLTTLKIYQADQQKAEDDACRMEHIVSDDSIMCLNSFLRNDGRYQRAITGYNLHSRYAVGTYPGIMGIYQISEETCPRRLAEEFYDYKRDILLNVELGKSHFVLQKKEENEAVRKFCRSLKKENGQLTHQLSGAGALFVFLKI